MLTSVYLRKMKKERLAQKLSQVDLHKKAGVALGTIWRVEQGLPIKPCSAEKIAAALGKTVEWLE